MKSQIAFISFLIFLISCTEKREKNVKSNEVVTINHLSTNYDTLVYKVKNGDRDSYDELFYSFMDANEAERTDSLMIYSKIMAEKFNYEKAYYDYFKALCEKYGINVDFSDYSNINIKSMNESEKNQANDWLRKMLKKQIITQKQYDSVKK
jgi:hypothetical protein